VAALSLCMCVGTVGATTACQTNETRLESEANRAVEQMRGTSMTLQPAGRPGERELRRREVTQRLHDLGATAIHALLQALRDPDVQMRRNAALMLINLGGGYSPEATPPLDIRTALPSLIQSTKDPDSHVRAWAAHAIAEMGPAGEPAIPALLILLRDSEEGPRNNSCLALGRIGPAAAGALPSLRDALNDPSGDTRRFAEKAIDRIEKK
jgi:HEAT repeats